MKLTTKRLGRSWWIVGDEDAGPYGPYDVRAEAEEDRRGIARTLRNQDQPGFITCETRRASDAHIQ